MRDKLGDDVQAILPAVILLRTSGVASAATGREPDTSLRQCTSASAHAVQAAREPFVCCASRTEARALRPESSAISPHARQAGLSRQAADALQIRQDCGAR